MDSADAFGSSTAPLTWHDFLERMRQPSAVDFVKAIKSFIVSFLNNPPDPERDSAAVQEFLSSMEAAFRGHSLWAGCSEEELESAGEGLEKYVMTKLFNRVFASASDDVKSDDELYEKMALIQQFIRPENLDIKPLFQNETSWLLAQKELQKINMYKAPRDKLACILNCCKVINNLLLNASIASNENPPGADEFIPVLIFVTIKANPPQLHSNLLYIQRYRRHSKLVAETAYYFTNMLSAESFIQNLDANAISMDETEFLNNMESARALMTGLSAQDSNSESVKQEEFSAKKKQDSALKPQISIGAPIDSKSTNKAEMHEEDRRSLNKDLSISDLENEGASMLLKDDQANRIFHDFPYLFSQSGNLTINDVEELLQNYKQLVFKYVCLSKGLGIASSSPSLSLTQSQSLHLVENVKELEDTEEVELKHDTDKDIEKLNSENVEESEGMEEVESKNEREKHIEKLGRDLNGISLLGAENEESKLPQDGTVGSQGEVNDETNK